MSHPALSLFPFTPTLTDISFLSRFNAILFINEKFCAAFPALFLLWSSLKATSYPMQGVLDSPIRTDGFVYLFRVRFKTADIHSGFFQSRLSTFVITFRLNLYQGAQVLPFLPVFKRDKSQTTEQRLVSTHPWQQSVSSETKTTGKKRKQSVYTKLGIVPGSRRLKRFILTEITYR